MIRIPAYYKTDLDFAEASRSIKVHFNGDLLEGMEAFRDRWIAHCENPNADDDKFFEDWGYEANAYNVVFEGFSKLFA